MISTQIAEIYAFVWEWALAKCRFGFGRIVKRSHDSEQRKIHLTQVHKNHIYALHINDGAFRINEAFEVVAAVKMQPQGKRDGVYKGKIGDDPSVPILKIPVRFDDRKRRQGHIKSVHELRGVMRGDGLWLL